MGIGQIDMDRSDRKAPGRVSAGFSSAGRKGPFASGRSQERRSREPQLMPCQPSPVREAEDSDAANFLQGLEAGRALAEQAEALDALIRPNPVQIVNSFTDAFCSGISGMGCWSSEFHHSYGHFIQLDT